MKIDLHSFMNHILLFQNSKFQAEESLIVRKTGRPTFVQFIDYLLRIEVWFKGIMDRFCKNLIILFFAIFPCFKVAEYNDHWRPYWLHCNLCRLDFDIIVKFETISEDTNVIEGKLLFFMFILFDEIQLSLLILLIQQLHEI